MNYGPNGSRLRSNIIMSEPEVINLGPYVITAVISWAFGVLTAIIIYLSLNPRG